MFLEHQISILDWFCDTEDWSNDAENSASPSEEEMTFEKLLKYKAVKLFHNSTVLIT